MITQLSENMKAARRVLKLTQDRAANKIGVARHCLASYEEGRCQPSIPTLVRIMEAYQIPFSDLKEFIHTPDYFVDCKIT